MPSYPWCEHLQFSYGNMRSCNDGRRLYGGYAQYVYLEPGVRAYKIPDGLPNDMACFTEVMCVAYTLEKAREFSSFDLEGFNFGDTVVVQGCGPLGIAHIAMARMLGAGKIIATDISDYKLDIARAFGADVVLNVENTTPEERIARIKAETNGRGAEIEPLVGLRYVAELVRRPGTDLTASRLAAVVAGGGVDDPLTGGEPVLDGRALHDYRRRIAELERAPEPR